MSAQAGKTPDTSGRTSINMKSSLCLDIIGTNSRAMIYILKTSVFQEV
jgi:hypothetical protein